MNRRTFLKAVVLVGGSLWPLRSTLGRLRTNSQAKQVQSLGKTIYLPMVQATGNASVSPIDVKYATLGGPSGFLGPPITPETATLDGVGRYREYQNGWIHWHPNTGAHMTYGAIREKWAALGWERSFLGYPLTDTTPTPDGVGRYTHFQGGSIHWSPSTPASAVSGAIRDKWASLGWERSFLGYPLTDEIINPDQRGRRQHFQGALIYWTTSTGAHVIGGDIFEQWGKLGWEQSNLGYPTSDEEDAPGGGRISYFERGSIRWRLFATPLTFFVQNMALLVDPAPYNGTDREGAIRSLIDNLRRDQPDVVGLCEVFADGESARIKRELGSIYPHSIKGLDKPFPDLHSDGGLLLLSKHAIIENHETFYTSCSFPDCWADKGAIHARIQAYDDPTPYDIFLTHTNASDRGVTQAQLTQLGSFVQAYSNSRGPALLMGDLNTDGYNGDCTDTPRPGLYEDLLNRLNFPEDLWKRDGTSCYGITSENDKIRPFEPGNEDKLPDDPRRHQRGTRIDYFLSWTGSRYWPTYQNTKPIIWQSRPGRDISDHYGLWTEQANLRELIVDLSLPINRITIALSKFHCLETTSGPGSDEVFFELNYNAANGAQSKGKTGVIENVDSGDIYTYPAPITMGLGDPGDWLDVTVKGWEWDTIGDNSLGSQTIRLERNELLKLLARSTEFGRSTTRVLPLLTGDGSQYAVTVTIVIE